MYNSIIQRYPPVSIRVSHSKPFVTLCVYTQRRGRGGRKEMRKRERDVSISILMGSKCAYCYVGLFHLIHHEYIFMSIHFHEHNFKIQDRVLNRRTII